MSPRTIVTTLLTALAITTVAAPAMAGAGDLDLTWSGCAANPCTSSAPVNGFEYDTNALARQADGKLLVGGSFNYYDGNGTPNRLKRLTTAGTLDTSWGPGSYGLNGNVFSVIVDGSSVFASGTFGGFYPGLPGTLIRRYGVVKLNLADGTINNTFTGCTGGAACGNSSGQPSGLDGQVSVVARDAYGLLAGGTFTNYDPLTPANTKSRRGVARLNATTGTIDITNWLCDGGFTASSGTMEVKAMVLQPDGKILVGGNFNSYTGSGCTSGGGSVTRNYVARLNSDGSLDTTFAPVGTGLNGAVSALALQADGKVLAGGVFTQYNGTAVSYLTRLNADGTRDTSFAQTGSGVSGAPTALLLDPSGRIFVGGNFSLYNGSQCAKLLRLDGSGALDTSFACQTAVNGFDGAPSALVLDSTAGDLYVAGAFTNFGNVRRNRMARMNGQAPPSAPQSPAATAGQEQATVTWAAPATDGGSAVTGYAVTATPGGATCAPSTATGTTCTVTGLTGGTAYTFSVVAINAVGLSPGAVTSAVTPTAAPVTPGGGSGSTSNAVPEQAGGASGGAAQPTAGRMQFGRVSASIAPATTRVSTRAAVNQRGRLVLRVTRIAGSNETAMSRLLAGSASSSCTDRVTARAAGRYTLSCALGGSMQTALRVRSQRVRVSVTFTPSNGGAAVTRTRIAWIAKAKATGISAVTG